MSDPRYLGRTMEIVHSRWTVPTGIPGEVCGVCDNDASRFIRIKVRPYLAPVLCYCDVCDKTFPNILDEIGNVCPACRKHCPVVDDYKQFYAGVVCNDEACTEKIMKKARHS